MLHATSAGALIVSCLSSLQTAFIRWSLTNEAPGLFVVGAKICRNQFLVDRREHVVLLEYHCQKHENT